MMLLLGLGHDHGVADRPAALADDRPDRDGAAEQHGHGTVVKRLAVEDELVGPGNLAAAGHAADHAQPGDLAVDLLQEVIGAGTRTDRPARSSTASLGILQAVGPWQGGLGRLVQPERVGASRPGSVIDQTASAGEPSTS